jgi:hypothetical protein
MQTDRGLHRMLTNIGALACLKGAIRRHGDLRRARKWTCDRFVYFVWQQALPRSLYFAALTIAGGCHELSPGGMSANN